MAWSNVYKYRTYTIVPEVYYHIDLEKKFSNFYRSLS